MTLPNPWGVKMTAQRNLVRFDWAMKNILRNKANFDILEGFLSELLQEQIKIDKLLESESNQERAFEKFNRVDLLAHTANDEKIIIEVQTASEWDFYHRILFGTSKVISEYLDLGKPYSTLPKVISVSILHFNLGVGSDYMYKGSTEFTGMHSHDVLQLSEESLNLYIKNLDKEYSSVSDIFPTYYLIQLEKFTGEVRDKFDQWVYLLCNESIQDDFDAQGIRSAKEKLDILKLSESERRAYDKYWQDVSFEASLAETYKVKLDLAVEEAHEKALEEGIKKGIKKGIEKGIEKGKAEIARALIAQGVSLDIIVNASGLSQEELLKLVD
jgi:predicted transposase/invertase (TIGR01784 family)